VQQTTRGTEAQRVKKTWWKVAAAGDLFGINFEAQDKNNKKEGRKKRLRFDRKIAIGRRMLATGQLNQRAAFHKH
jgi:hypothetical protein